MLKSCAFILSVQLKDKVATNAYPFSIPSIGNLTKELSLHPNVTFFVGENGSGKSTLLEAIAQCMGFSAQGGTRNVMLDDAIDSSGLHESLFLRKGYAKPKDGYFLRAESFYNVATYMDEVGYLASYGNRSLHRQSHGESFMATLINKFRGNGLYLLDEPEAALSPSRQLAALVRIHDLVKMGSQFIIATHSPILMAYPEAKIVLFDSDGMRETAYELTEHYVITSDFVRNYKKRLHQLLAESEDETDEPD